MSEARGGPASMYSLAEGLDLGLYMYEFTPANTSDTGAAEGVCNVHNNS